MTALASDEVLYGICLTCGRSHHYKNRVRLIAPMVDHLTFTEIREAWPCFYPPGPFHDSVARKLWRDIARVRAGRVRPSRKTQSSGAEAQL